MKIRILLGFTAVLGTAGLLNAQQYKLNSFTVRYLTCNAYVIWVAVEPEEESLYLLERSSDNVHYELLCTKEGAKSPSGIELMNCFTDKNPLPGFSYYRIRRFSKEGCIASDPIILNAVESIQNSPAELVFKGSL